MGIFNRDRRGSWGGDAVLLVLGLAFCFGAIWSATRAVPMLTRYVGSLSWQETPAEITKISLNYGHNNDTNVYSLEAAYQYRFEGADYSGDRVTLAQNEDSFRTYWVDLERSLKSAQSRGTAVAWVNPNDPNEAVLDRSFRLRLFAFRASFVLLFGMIGIGCLLLVVAQWRKSGGAIRTQEHGLTWGGYIFGAALVMMGVFPYLFVDFRLTLGVVFSIIVSGLITLGGLYILRQSWRTHRALRKTGRMILHLGDMPVRIGAKLNGQFDVLGDRLGQPIQMTIRCIETLHTGDYSSKNELWQTQVLGKSSQSFSNIVVKFTIEIPAHTPPTGAHAKDRNIAWELSAKGQVLDASGQAVEVENSWDIIVEPQAPS